MHCVFARLCVSLLLSVVATTAASAQTLQRGPTPARDPGQRIVTITLAGDTGYAPNNARVQPKGVRRHGRFQTWADTTRLIRPEIDGELNFVNIETVVTDRNDLRRDTKGQRGPFNFRTHPNGVRHLVKAGFNLMSLANNHSMDYGLGGLKETLKHVARLRRAGLIAANGIGLNREEASRPSRFTIKGAPFAFSSIGIVTNNLARHRAGPNKPGQIAYRFDSDFDLSVRRLAKTPAAYRILSVHYGIEGRVRADARQIKDFRRKAALGAGIDLIVGHHAHVPRGVEIANGRVIFYGLGNFLHHGTANMSAKGICRDFGLFAKVHLLRGANGRFRARAIEAIALTGMHARPRPMGVGKARARMHALNYLAGRLGGSGGKARGVRFTPQRNGHGLYCFPGAGKDPGRIGRLCRGWQPAGAIPARLRGRIAGSCRR
ncbi:MAG: CapA family protein [Pseudomonadota bacterium]